jgi:hypothetical protein
MVRLACFAAIPRLRNGSAPCSVSPTDFKSNCVSAAVAIWNRAQSFHKKIAGPPQKNHACDELSRKTCTTKIVGSDHKTAEHPNRDQAKLTSGTNSGAACNDSPHSHLSSSAISLTFILCPSHASVAQAAAGMSTELGRRVRAGPWPRLNHPDRVIARQRVRHADVTESLNRSSAKTSRLRSSWAEGVNHRKENKR